MADKKQAVDWAAIERDYRAGTQSIREIAAWYSISDTAIRKKAKADGWTRAEKPEGSQAVRAANLEPVAARKAPRIEEVIGRGRNLADRLLDELDAETLQRGELETIIMMSEEDPARQTALKQAVSLPVRAKALHTIAAALKTLGETAQDGKSGKKAARQAKAEEASSGGKFAVPSAPKLVVDNKR